MRDLFRAGIYCEWREGSLVRPVTREGSFPLGRNRPPPRSQSPRVNPSRRRVRTNPRGGVCPSCKAPGASSWKRIPALEGDDRHYCNKCYQHHRRNGVLPEPSTVFLMAHLDSRSLLYTPEQQAQDPCPNCHTTSSTCWLRIRSQGQARYCVDCYKLLAPKHGPRHYPPVERHSPPPPPVNGEAPGTPMLPSPAPPPPGVRRVRPELKYPHAPSKTDEPCPWCGKAEDGYWRRIREIGDGQWYCNTCSTHFRLYKQLKTAHRNRFADEGE